MTAQRTDAQVATAATTKRAMTDELKRELRKQGKRLSRKSERVLSRKQVDALCLAAVARELARDEQMRGQR